MQLIDYMQQNESKMNDIEKQFVEDVFYPYAGENGLDYLNAQTPFEDFECRIRKLDFTIATNRFRYVIEIDGYTYHAEGAQRVSPEYFDDLIMKQNDLILNGYILIRFSYNQIRNHPDVCINTLRRSFKADAEINPYYLHSSEIQPTFPQQKSLEACEYYRNTGLLKGVVILPTGMGKTIFAAIDAKRLNCRTLFVVHKNEILREAHEKFNFIWPGVEKGFFDANEKDTVSQVIFASKDTLYRDGNLEQFDPQAFGLIIIDEVHHSSCTTYRKIIDYFRPQYMLGMTATPERQDRADILELFDYNIYYELSQREAIESGYLSGFRYYGLTDDIDYSRIRHNGIRYDVADLGRKLNIPERNEAILRKYQELVPNTKAIGFCVNIDHAISAAEFFAAHGISAKAVHSDTSRMSDVERKNVIQDFKENQIQIVFTVDLFNEGVDFPDVETLLFLRPTESKTIFIQQLGRGLRLSPNKTHVTVLDFIGNFKKAANIREYLNGAAQGGAGQSSGNNSFGVKNYLDWPLGCDVHFDASVDPACGSGSLLVRAIEEPPFEIAGYGQEKDSYTSCLAKTNAVLHNKAYITIKAGNTFSNPQYNKEYDSELRHFDYIVANPPFGAASAGGKRRPGLLGKNCSRELLHEVVTKAINEAFREKEAILPLLRGNIVISLEEVTSNQIAAIDEQMRSMQQELLATIN